MPDLAYSSTIQDSVAGLIFQQAYANLSAAQKVIIDGTSASSPPTAGAALSAWNIVNQYAQWWYQAGATLAPPAWQHWLIHTIVRIVGVNFRPDRAADYFRLEQESKQAALDTFVAEDINAATLIGGTTTAPSLRSIRFAVMNATIRREKRLFVSPQEIDSATMYVCKQLWGRSKWIFSRRAVTFTLTPFAVTDAKWTTSTKTITAPVTIPLSAATGTFTVGEIVTESTSGATGTVVSASDTTCRLRRTSVGTFTGGQTLTGGTSGFTATGGTISNPFSTSIVAGSQVAVTAGATATLASYTVASTATVDTVVLTASIGATNGDTDISATAVAVTSTLATGEVFNKISSNTLTYADTGETLAWGNADQMAMNAVYTGATTGRPERFRFTRKAPTTIYWQFSPIPDEVCTLTGEVVLDGPTTPSGATGATDTDMFALFPEAFWPHMKEAVLARVLIGRGGAAGQDGQVLWAQYDNAVESMMGEYVDPGNPDSNQNTPRDVYGDVRQINTGGGGWPFDMGGGGL